MALVRGHMMLEESIEVIMRNEVWKAIRVLPETAAAASLRFCTGVSDGGSSALCSVNIGALKGFARESCVSVVGYMSDAGTKWANNTKTHVEDTAVHHKCVLKALWGVSYDVLISRYNLIVRLPERSAAPRLCETLLKKTILTHLRH